MSALGQLSELLAIFDSGVNDFVSIIPPGAMLSTASHIPEDQRGKAPGVMRQDGTWSGASGWQNAAPPTRAELERIIRTGANVGLRSRAFPGIDCDVENPTHAAELREIISGILGVTSPYRVGRPPKFLIPCRTAAPFPKRKIRLTAPDGSDAGAVEFLADGQQYLVAGLHPKTGALYSWHHGASTGGAGVLLAYLRAHSLPELTAELLDSQLLPAITEWAMSRGLQVNQTVGRTADRRSDQQNLRAPSTDLLRSAMALIPNDERDWDRYVQFAAAVRAAAGPDDELDGFDIFVEWAARYEAGPHDPAQDRATWDSVKPPHDLGWPFIADHARAFGFNDAALDFDVVVGAEPPAPAVMPLPTEGERIAALLEDAARPFLRELATLEDGTLRERWSALEAAQRHGDPLRGVFDTAVIREASRARAPLDDERRFSRLLKADLAHNKSAAWLGCSPADQELLLRAAFTLLADHGTLARRIGASPGAPLPLVEHTSRDDLIEGWLPRRGLGAIVSPPGQGKTHAAIALGASVALPPRADGTLNTFAGRAVQHGTVLYLAGEDGAGVAGRAARTAKKYGAALEHLHVFAKGPPLSSPSDSVSFVLEAIAELPPDAPRIALIVIDTFRSAFVGEENSSGDVSAATTAAAVLGRMLDSAVVLVHHATKSNPQDPRGSSAFLASLDFMMVMNEKVDDRVSITVAKVKNGPDGQTFNWNLVDGVLQEGSTMMTAPSHGEEAWAAAAAHAIRAVAGHGITVTRTVLVEEMIATNPGLFSKEHVKETTARSRISRGINSALGRGWIKPEGRGNAIRFQPGENAPSAPSPDEFDLASLV